MANGSWHGWLRWERTPLLSPRLTRLQTADKVRVCIFCQPLWSASGEHLYLLLEWHPETPGRMYAIRLAPGSMWPALPAGGITSEEQLEKLSRTVIPMEKATDF